MARNGFLILDSDLHMMEPDDLWARYLERAAPGKSTGVLRRTEGKATRRKPRTRATPTRSWAWRYRAFASRHTTCSRARPPPAASCAAAAEPATRISPSRGRRATTPASTLTAMDVEGIDVAVMYGTRGRQILCHDDLAPDYAAALASAYNDWAHDYCQSNPRRLKFAAQVAMHDVAPRGRGSTPQRSRSWAPSP